MKKANNLQATIGKANEVSKANKANAEWKSERKSYKAMTASKNGKLTAKALKLVQNKRDEANANAMRFFEAVRKDKEAKITKYDKCADDITDSNILQMSVAITIKALKTNYCKSGQKFIGDMYNDAVQFAREIERYTRENETYSLKNWIPTYHKEVNGETSDLNKPSIANCDIYDDLPQNGADLIQDTALYLSQYIGKKLTDKVIDGRKNKDGEIVSILTGAFYNLRTIIYGHEQREYKCQYLDDYDEDGKTLRVPFHWDVSQKSQLERIYELIKLLDLTPIQQEVLRFKMRGLSLSEIGDLRGCSKQAIAYTIKQIQAKALKLFGGNTIDCIRQKYGPLEIDETDIEY